MAFEIVKGSTKTILVSLTKKEDGTPISLVGFTGATGWFLDEDSERLGATGSLVSADCGQIEIALSAEQTDQLQAVDAGDFEVEVDKGSEKIIAQIIGKIRVLERLFSDSSC